jgi:tetratricopeptide (TPR) repeat protein
VPGAVLAAFVFALHPVHVESVAWITELKNTLSGVFYFAAALVYLKFDDTRSSRLYGIALVLFVLALLSKTVTATLPAGLLIVLWWKRGSLDWRRDVVPLLAMFAFGIAGGAMTAWFEHAYIGARGAAFDFTFIERCLIAGRAVWFYLVSLVWPVNLSFVYPRWQVSQSVWWQYVYPIAMIGLLAALWLYRGRSRAPLAALLFFGVTLGPALGFVNVYPFKFSFVADHFQYLASASIIALVCAAIARGFDRPSWTKARSFACVVLVGVLGVLAWRQSHDYVNAATLYRATIARNPGAVMAHTNLAMELNNSGDPAQIAEGVEHARLALQFEPDDVEARFNLAGGLMLLGRFGEALTEYDVVAAALAASPMTDPQRMAAFHRSYGKALHASGRKGEAIVQYAASLRIAPDSAATHTDLGVALGQQGRVDEAIQHFSDALRLEPSVADRHTNLGSALMQAGRVESALAEYRAAVALAPNVPDVYADLGTALLAAGRAAEAIPQFEAALRLDPNDSRARGGLARARGKS